MYKNTEVAVSALMRPRKEVNLGNEQSIEQVNEHNQEPKADEPIVEKVEINKLLDEGYSVKQIIDLGFNRRTVYHYAKQRMKPEGNPVKGNNPANGTVSKGKHELMKIGAKELIPPEQALGGIRLQDGDYKLGFIDGMGTLIMAARYNQILAASQAEIITSQINLWKEAKESSRDIAQEAAREAAREASGEVISWLAREKPWAAASPDPFKAMIADTMKPLLSNIVGAFVPKQAEEAAGGTTPPGFTEER